MNQIPIDPNIWTLAGQVCTEKQLVVLDLRERHGYSWNMIAITLNSTRTTVKEHHAAATRNILNALEQTNGGPPSTSPSPKPPSPSSSSTPETPSSSDSKTDTPAQPKPNRSSTPSNTPAPDTKSSSSPTAQISESSDPKTKPTRSTPAPSTNPPAKPMKTRPTSEAT